MKLISQTTLVKMIGRLIASIAALWAVSATAHTATHGVSQATEEAWQAAEQKASMEAYASFIIAYPDSKYTKVAYDRLSDSDGISRALNPAKSGSAVQVAAVGDHGVGLSSVTRKLWWLGVV